MVLSNLCSTCQQAFCPDLLEEWYPFDTRDGSHHATQESFLNAVSNGCVICASIKELLERNDRPMSIGAETGCFPLSCEYRLTPMGVFFFIHYRVPNGCEELHSSSYLEFRLSPRTGIGSPNPGHGPHSYAESWTSSSATLELALKWIDNCRCHHSECRKLQENEPWWPSRLIDIGNEDDGMWKIVSLPDKLQPPPTYMTLSYRWGTTVNFRLLKKNLHSFQNGLPIADLPRTFQDAASVARKFSVRFLWIDALCIIQDCSEDWAHESAAMRLVYANALCNLAAVASSDSCGGLFRSRNPEDLRPSLVRAALDKSTPLEDYYAIDSKYLDNQFLDKGLLKRGWVFQERLLCPRVLYFAEKQVFWECFAEQRCEVYPDGIPRFTSSKAQSLSIITGIERRALEAEERPTLRIVTKWEELVQGYTDCELTKASDRLFAIEGIANLFRDSFHDEYVFGLWKMELVRQLSYYVESPCKESSSQYIAPSWSWASLQSPVRYEAKSCWPSTAEHVTLLDLDPLQGNLRLYGHAFTARIDTTSMYNVVAGDSRICAQIYPDRVGMQVDMPEVVTILPVLSYWVAGRSMPGLGCLVLEPILVMRSRSYRRIAYIKIEQGQDLAFFGIKVFKDGSARIDEVALSIISLM
ncbi:hypothetical protein FOYG_03834 [Fusarium oxysporum NRRL 32931]|uniref:Heterokaryon incompatibility domain-containing protein n=1 Tax=Fusarium oxysporum NRRL 32931 TaxID=660029 RepID=W9J2X0_FUSOX|nr:hypothetical protein FOYG_03834 [Fusarium oxysporum NRRL 32931]